MINEAEKYLLNINTFYSQDHKQKMSEFVTILTRMHQANQLVQEEAAKLVQTIPPEPTPQPPFSSPLSIFTDKLYKSVSFAGVDTQYSPKESPAFQSLPSTPKKVSNPLSAFYYPFLPSPSFLPPSSFLIPPSSFLIPPSSLLLLSFLYFIQGFPVNRS
jgi:hypothetical protein